VKPTEEWLINVKAEASYLPFDVIKTNDKYYINRTIDKPFEFSSGTEILCINDIPIAQIWDSASNIIERDGYITTLVDQKISNSFRTYFYFLYAKQEKFEIRYKNNIGELLDTKVLATKEKLSPRSNMKLPENITVQQKNSWSIFGVDNKNKVAYLKINHFADRKEYKDYYSNVFEFLKNNLEYKDLIIDLRGNSGGYFKNGDELLKYLLTDKRFYFKFYREKRDWNKNKHVSLGFQNTLTKLGFSLKPDKFKYENKRTYSFDYEPYHKKSYNGRLHIIIDGETFSQASLVASSLKDINAAFYGEESGGTANGNNAMLMYSLVLPNSKIRVSIPYYRIETKNPENYPLGRGVLPDFELKSSINMLLENDKDKLLGDTIEIIINGAK
jgi:C-terminal processing protease CtpA/Prc